MNNLKLYARGCGIVPAPLFLLEKFWLHHMAFTVSPFYSCAKDLPHIEAERKWLIFCRRHLQMHFLNESYCVWFKFESSIISKSALVMKVPRCQVDNKPLFKLMVDYFSDAYTLLGFNELNITPQTPLWYMIPIYYIYLCWYRVICWWYSQFHAWQWSG